MKNSLFICCIPFLFTACMNNEDIKFDKPPSQAIKKIPIVKKKKGSLYSVKGPSLFADKKDLQIGDIIQIKISESLSSTTNNKREVSANRTNSLGGGLLTPKTGNTLSGVASSSAKAFNSKLGIDFGSTSTSANNGEVKTKLSETFSANVSAIIEETYQNGNYYVKGLKEMLVDGQKQSLVLTGVIRPYDITSDNSISSSQIANLKILYQKDGEEQDVLHVPWGTSIIQKFWPF